MRVFSYGGGVQSNAVLVLQAQGRLDRPYDAFVFANVGADSENPATLDYVETYAKPYAAAHGIDLIEIQHHRETLREHIFRTKRSVPIPARMSNGAPGHRSCTSNFKIRVVDRWLKDSASGGNVYVGLGISIDEYQRMRVVKNEPLGKLYKTLEYPLIDQRITRRDCRYILGSAGLPQAPKSSCYFCPYRKRSEWIEMRRESPDLFERAAEIDDHINEKRAALDKDRVYLHPDCVPLRQAVPLQPTLFDYDDSDVCESGYCMT